MDMESIEIWNFKSIKYSGKISIPKITILIGPNNSGKSSIIQAILLMKQTMEMNEPSLPLVLNGQYAKLGEYKDFIYDQKINKKFSIKFNFKAIPSKNPYGCFLCEKQYKEEAWLLKHLKSNHQFFWNNYRDIIPIEKYAKYLPPSIKFTFSYDSENKDILIKEIEITNPPKFEGLILSSLKFIQMKNKKIKIEATSYNDKIIFSKIFRFPGETGYKELEFIDINSIFRSFRFFQFFQHVSRKIQNEGERILLLDYNIGDKLSIDIMENILRDRSFYYSSLSAKRSESFELSDEQKVAFGMLSRIGQMLLYINNYLSVIRGYVSSFGHLGPLRISPERIYFSMGGKPSSVGDKGQFTQEILWRDKRVNHENLIRKLNHWLKLLKLNCEIEIFTVGVGEMYQLKIKQNNLSVNITDVGVGISQVLPILTECINFSLLDSSRSYPYKNFPFNPYDPYLHRTEIKEKTLSIEQPEIHLNPRIQAELGDFFIQFINSNLNFLIETHSEHIISRIQRRIADKTITPKDVVIYYVSKGKKKFSEITKITISKDGTFSYWPDGFFQDDYEDALHILKESLKNHKE
jgi:predicted ATPase